MSIQKCSKECKICNQRYYLYWTKEDFIEFLDFFRWKEILAVYVATGLIWFIFGFGWALVYHILIQLVENVSGGTLIGYYPEEPEKKPCSAGIKDCCGNGYSHEWNVAYRKNLKWYERSE